MRERRDTLSALVTVVSSHSRGATARLAARLASSARHLAVGALLWATAGTCLGGPRASAAYSVSGESYGSGGGKTTSANYTHESTVGEIGSTAASGAYVAKAGFSGQGYSIVGLVLDSSPTTINEGQTRQLEAFDLLDDTTRIGMDETDVLWSVQSGPIISISNSGLATAGVVYQNTNASVGGTRGSHSASLLLSVMNVATDDFGIYANDAVDDAWQVQYFGENNANGVASADPDGDGQNNKFEFVAGVVPTSATSRFSLHIATVAGQPSQRQLIFSPALPDRSYAPQFRTSLTSGNWSALTGTTQTDNGSERTVLDLNATGAAKFYRIDISKP
jgi:hypothetical protein